MRAAVLTAESEDWLSAGLCRLHETEATWPAIRVSRQAAPSDVGSHGALNLVPCSELALTHDNDTCVLGASVARDGCPVPRTPRRLLTATLASLALHLSVAVAAIGLIQPANAPVAEPGGDSVLDVVVIGAEEAAALLEGARPEPVSFAVQPSPQPDPVSPLVAKESPPPDDPRIEPEPLVAAPPPPVADIPQLDRSRNGVSTLPSPPPAIPQPPVEQRQVEARPLETVKTPPRTVAQKAKRPRSPDPVRQNAKALGQQGEGQAEASRAAQSRGGTGGQSSVAGHSAITSYRSQLIAHLTRYKTYPEQAQERGLMGRNAVTLIISRDGRVVSAMLSNGSGHSILDSATMAAVRRAQPFPAIPDGGPATVTVTIGLNYALR